MALTHADIQLLEFENTHPRHTGLKVDAIRMRLGMTAARYYQRLHWLTRQQEVVAQWPQMSSRVQRRVSRRIEEREQLREWLS